MLELNSKRTGSLNAPDVNSTDRQVINFYLSLAEVLHISQTGSVHVLLQQYVTFTCEAIASAGVFWFYNGVHISENQNPNLHMKESVTVLMDAIRCIRQKNLTVLATPETDKIYLDCRAIGIATPIITKSLPINITVEGNKLAPKLCTSTNAVFIMK